MIRIYLSKLLGERKLTQNDLAQMTGIRPTTIGEMYHEIIQRVNIDHIDKICEALGCTIEELMEYVPKTHSGHQSSPSGHKKAADSSR
ncbi:MAG TPA: XRE family transcriptional regulator [Ruminococcaceae bacterium]|jgi:putative transcriptional regulator|nr:XRE family transcriptional regulator [Oscillospiraceae bacterium]